MRESKAMTSRVRILVDCHAFDQPMRQGITTYLAGLYREAVLMAPEMDFCFAAENINTLKSVFGNAPNAGYIKLGKRGRFMRLAYEFPRLIEQGKFDYAHFQYTAPLVKRCREIITMHDILFCDFPQLFSMKYRISKKMLFRCSARRADILLTVSDYSKQRIAANWNINKYKIRVTPNAVGRQWELPPSAVQTEGKTKYPFSRYILFVSRIEPRKNHAGLLRCFRELQLWKRGIGLIFVGADAEKYDELSMEKSMLSSMAEPFVVRYRNLDETMLRSIYAGADLFVYPSLAEGFGIPPLEAAVSGIPCLCSDRTAMHDYDFFGNGLFDPGNNGELKCKISDFFDGKLKLPDVNEVKKMVMGKYSWESSAQILIDAVKKDSGAAFRHEV